MTDSIMTVISRKELAEIHKALSLTINERDEARDEVMKWRKELTLCNQERFDAQTQLAEARVKVERFETHNLHLVKTIDSNRAEDGNRITGLEAEVERLRPAAEAWIAYDDYMMCPEEHEAEKFQVWVAAHNAAKSAQVARAAKEAKP